MAGDQRLLTHAFSHGPIGDLQRAVDDRKPLPELRFGDAQRRVGEEIVPPDDGVQTFLAEELPERRHFSRGAVERRQRLPGAPIANQLDDPEQPDRAHGADGRMPAFEIGEQVLHHDPERPGVVDQPIVLVHLNRRQRRGARQRMAVVGQAAVEDPVLELVGDSAPHADRAELHVGAGQPLRHRQDVRHHTPVIDGEPLAGAAEARHHLVADHQNAVLRTQLADAFEVAVRRHAARRWFRSPVRG